MASAARKDTAACGATVFDPFLLFCRATVKLLKRPVLFVDDHLQLTIETLISWCAKDRSAFVLEQALHALWKLTMQEPTAAAVVERGGVQLLVDVCDRESVEENLRAYAASSLGNLACWTQLQPSLVEHCTTEALLSLIDRSSSLKVLEAATASLWLLCQQPECQRKINELNGTQTMLALCRRVEQVRVRGYAAGILRVLTLSEPSRISVLNQAGLATLVALCKSDNATVVEQAVGALANMAENDDARTELLETKGIDTLLDMLQLPLDVPTTQSPTSDPARARLRKGGSRQHLSTSFTEGLELPPAAGAQSKRKSVGSSPSPRLPSTSPTQTSLELSKAFAQLSSRGGGQDADSFKGVVEAAARALALVALNCEPARRHIEKSGGLQMLLNLVARSGDASILLQALSALESLVDGDRTLQAKLAGVGCGTILACILRSDAEDVRAQACRVVAVLARHHDVAASAKQQGCDALAVLRNAFTTGDGNTRKEAETAIKILQRRRESSKLANA